MTCRLILAIFILTIFSNCKISNFRKDTATSQLNALKRGVLFIRLPTNEAKIAKLKKIGKEDLAKKESATMAQFHVDIIKSFDKYFDFCPVYFYYSDASTEIKKGNFEGNLFDAQLKNITSLSFPKKQRFYAEFGTVHQEELVVEKDGQPVKVAGIAGKKAFVIRTYEGIQPLRPFPYTVNYYYRGDGSLINPVIKINRELNKAVSDMERRKLRRTRRGKA